MRHLLCRSVVFLFFIAGFLTLEAAGQSPSDAAIPGDPIAFIGHGMLLDKNGNVIRADLDFMERAQDTYIAALRARLLEADRNAFDDQRAEFLRSNTIDRHNGMPGIDAFTETPGT